MNISPMAPLAISCAIAALFITLAANQVPQVPKLQETPPKLNCTNPPTFTTGYQHEEGGIIPQGEGFRFQGVSWLQTDICTSGTLAITADGEIAEGQAPILNLNLNNSPIQEISFDSERRTINVRIPQAGRLTLAYLNDYYLAEVRIATLENFKFVGGNCDTFTIDVPKATGGQWLPEHNKAFLVSNVAMTIVPCATGTLTLRIVGRAGQGEFPILTFAQGGKTLLKITTALDRQQIKLPLSKSPLVITLINPYGRTLADRNLNVRSLKFTPDDAKLP